MHSILPSIAASELDVSREKIFLLVERGKLNAKKTEHGTRIKIDAQWRRFKKGWDAEDVPTEPTGVVDYTAYTGGDGLSRRIEAAQERREATYALIDDGVEPEEIADRLGISVITVQQYLRRRNYYTA